MNPALLAEKVARLGAPQLMSLEAYRAEIEALRGSVPHFDPDDGGDAADVLLLLETPGPRGSAIRFVSRDNTTGTARNIARFFEAAALARRRTVIWNAVPWLIHPPGARNRAPRSDELAAGIALLPALLALLPHLRVVVLCGRAAAAAAPTVARHPSRPQLLTMPHPSPTYVCTSPRVPERIVATLREAAAVAG